jgi:hypothetical protein
MMMMIMITIIIIIIIPTWPMIYHPSNQAAFLLTIQNIPILSCNEQLLRSSGGSFLLSRNRQSRLGGGGRGAIGSLASPRRDFVREMPRAGRSSAGITIYSSGRVRKGARSLIKRGHEGLCIIPV